MLLTRHLLPLAALLPLLAPTAPAQIVGGEWRTLHQFDGLAAGDGLGWSVSGAGDVDGDGLADLIVGAWRADPGGRLDAGSAFVYSGATGGLIWRFDGVAAGDWLGDSVSAAGDVDGDGYADLIVGAPHARSWGGSAFVYSGATGGLIWQFHGPTGSSDWLGHAVAGAGDVDGDGDGVPDLIVGATQGSAFAGAATVYSGATGSAIWQFGGASSGSHFGGSVAGAGDTDGDGFADLIVGAEEAEPGGRVRAGSAYVYSGATGSLLRQFDGAAAGDALGYSVSGAGDVDGDGAADLVVGALRANPGGLMGAGSAFVYSGASGSLIWQFDGASEHDFLGVSVSGAGDLDGDGHADLLVGATGVDLPTATNVGAASVYSGATGGLLGQFVGAATDDELGRAVAGAGDVDADGTPDLIVGAQPAWGTAAGSAFVYSLDPFLHAGARQLSATPGNPVPLTLDFPASEAGSSHAVLFSGAGTGPTIKGGLAIPLSQDNIFDRMLTGWSPPPLSNGFGVLDANGDAQASLDGDAVLLPLIGRTVYLAAVSYDPLGPTGRLSSIARALTIVP